MENVVTVCPVQPSARRDLDFSEEMPLCRVICEPACPLSSRKPSTLRSELVVAHEIFSGTHITTYLMAWLLRASGYRGVRFPRKPRSSYPGLGGPGQQLSRLPRGQSRLYWAGKYEWPRVGQFTQS